MPDDVARPQQILIYRSLGVELGEQIKRQLMVARKAGDPAGPEAKGLVEMHKAWLCAWWPDGMYSPCRTERRAWGRRRVGPSPGGPSCAAVVGMGTNAIAEWALSGFQESPEEFYAIYSRIIRGMPENLFAVSRDMSGAAPTVDEVACRLADAASE